MGKKILLTVLSLLLLLTGLQKMYDYFLKKNVNLKSSYVAEHRIEADVLFLGPCEPLWMMDPALFQKYTGLRGYNLSTVHANFAENEAMLHLYLLNNKPPAFLFLYVTTESVDGSFNVFNTYSFPQLSGDQSVKRLIREQDSSFSRWSILPFMKYAYYNELIHYNFLQGVKHWLTQREVPYFPDGFVPPHGLSWDGRLENFRRKYPNGRNFTWNRREIHYLQEVMDLAKRHGIQVVLYESPMLNEVKPFILNREEIREKISNFADRNGVSYWVFDTLRISASRFYFFSILNTNPAGSDIFNRSFADYFRKKYPAVCSGTTEK